MIHVLKGLSLTEYEISEDLFNPCNTYIYIYCACICIYNIHIHTNERVRFWNNFIKDVNTENYLNSATHIHS